MGKKAKDLSPPVSKTNKVFWEAFISMKTPNSLNWPFLSPSPNLWESFLRSRTEEMFKICYEYGCYVNFQTYKNEINFTVFSKIYFAGLNYYSLKETLREFPGCGGSTPGAH